jgi:hypothetical protein
MQLYWLYHPTLHVSASIRPSSGGFPHRQFYTAKWKKLKNAPLVKLCKSKWVMKKCRYGNTSLLRWVPQLHCKWISQQFYWQSVQFLNTVTKQKQWVPKQVRSQGQSYLTRIIIFFTNPCEKLMGKCPCDLVARFDVCNWNIFLLLCLIVRLCTY